MLKYKKLIFKYQHLLKISSFNSNSINSFMWLFRIINKYLFFFLLRKTYLIYFNYVFQMTSSYLCLNMINTNIIYTHNFIYVNSLFLHYYSYFYFIFSHYSLWGNLLLFSNFIKTKLSSFYNINTIVFSCYLFYYKYKKYIFLIYFWLYSIKIFKFYSFNWSNLPIKKSIFVVLRGPHKDKKSREKFKINKISKSICLPSFLYNEFIFNSVLNDSFSLKSFLSLKK